MFNPSLLTQIDALKARLDRIRPLAPDLVENLREVYNIRLTYHSNAIEGNTLTQSETQIVVEKGITIGGKPLKDHLNDTIESCIEQISSRCRSQVSLL